VALLVECLSRETRVQVAQTFGEAPVLSALEAAREREARRPTGCAGSMRTGCPRKATRATRRT